MDILDRFNGNIAPLLSKHSPTVHFLHGSFLSEAHTWSDADLVFANSTCFPDELIGKIEVQARRLKVGARVVTFTSSLRSEYFKVRLAYPPLPPSLPPSQPPSQHHTYQLILNDLYLHYRLFLRSVCLCRGDPPRCTSTSEFPTTM
jgi:hypothetical protein